MRALAALLALALSAPAHAESDRTDAPAVTTDPNIMIVLDGSGTMWGQIAGRPKIDLARSALARGLRAAPRDQAHGLIVYGGQRRGDCSDVAALAEPTTDAAEIRDAAAAVRPAGKTALGSAVGRAAAALNYRTQPARVLVIADGADTCGMDACALAAGLGQAAHDLAIDVVAISVDPVDAPRLRCLADLTGGRYRPVSDAAGLRAAVREALREAPPPRAPSPATLRATDLAGGPEITSGLTWRVSDAAGLVFETGPDDGAIERPLEPGYYTVEVTRAADRVTGRGTLMVAPDAPAALTVALEPLVTATLEAPETAEAGAAFTVMWDGPEDRAGFVAAGPSDLPDDAAPQTYAATRPAQGSGFGPLTAPIEAGPFEVRYVLAVPRRVLARAPVEALGGAASVFAPATAPAGSSVLIAWRGPAGSDDHIVLAPVGLPDDAALEQHAASAATAQNGEDVRLDTPARPGAYELRYRAGDGAVLARRPLRLAAAAAVLRAPLRTPAGALFEIGFDGPVAADAIITLAEADAPDTASRSAYLFYRETQRGNPAVLRAPGVPGTYEVRYVLERGPDVIARTPVEVTAIEAAIAPLDPVRVGAEFTVTVDAPVYPDSLAVFGAPETPDTAGRANYAGVARVLADGAAALRAPAEPGVYEVRYLLESAPETVVLARASLRVTDAAAVLEAPGVVAPGETFAVSVIGPSYSEDRVTLGPTRLAETASLSAYRDAARVTRDEPVVLTAPLEPGSYDIRYVLGIGPRTLARRTITVAPDLRPDAN